MFTGLAELGSLRWSNWATYELYEKREFEAILQLTAKETMLTTLGISGTDVLYSWTIYWSTFFYCLRRTWRLI